MGAEEIVGVVVERRVGQELVLELPGGGELRLVVVAIEPGRVRLLVQGLGVGRGADAD